MKRELVSIFLFLAFSLNAFTIDAYGASGGGPEEQAFELGKEAYTYALPLVLMEVTKGIMANVAAVNQLLHGRTVANSSSTVVVSPNNDTLYATAWLDLSSEPIILHVPDAGDRYYLIPVYDAWTNVIANPGTRTTGNRAGDFAVIGPAWKGHLPKEVRVIQSPTNMVWVIGRIYTNNTAGDLALVHAFQDRMSLTPLSSYGKPFTPPHGSIDPAVDRRTPPIRQVENMDAATFFRRFAESLKANPPLPADSPMVAKLAKIGIVPGRDFDFNTLDPAIQSGLARSVKAAQARLKSIMSMDRPRVNGWNIPPSDLGSYGTAYDYRAVVAAVGLGANLAADSIYPNTAEDGDGKPLNGAHRYVLHFEKGHLPPANPKGFWSVTLYNDRHFLVDNPLNRYAIHSADRLTVNADGSLDIILQKDSPEAGKIPNWLPAPPGNFSITIRIYWPEPQALNGTWVPPAIRLVN